MFLTSFIIAIILLFSRVIFLAVKTGEIKSYYEDMSANRNDEPKSYFSLLLIQLSLWGALLFLLVTRFI